MCPPSAIVIASSPSVYSIRGVLTEVEPVRIVPVIVEAVNGAAEKEIFPVAVPTAVVVPTANPSLDSSHKKIALSPVDPLSITRPRSFEFDPAPEFNSNKPSE